MQTAEPEVISHEPRSALASGQEGLDDLRLYSKVCLAIWLRVAC
jgi:methylase of polypeptide subunit release factors